MAYNADKPVTSSNCPTRAALERGPLNTGFLRESIHARHSRAKADRHQENARERAMRQASGNRTVKVKQS